MVKLTGINHIAFLSGDIDRLADFYERMFGAKTILDEFVQHGLETVRHAFIDIGGGALLHAFERPGNRWLNELPIMDRGRVDHYALNVATKDELDAIRERLVAEGATDGTVTDFGMLLSVFFRDPDGMGAEVCWFKDPA